MSAPGAREPTPKYCSGAAQVASLVQQGGGDDEMLVLAWNQIGDYYLEHQMIAKAAQRYEQSKNVPKLIECYALLEDYASLEKLIGQLTDVPSRSVANSIPQL